MNFTRRDTLKLLGAGAAAALTPGFHVPSSAPNVKTQRADVVVVGAGMAGMMAARSLLRQGKKVAVLEARGRVGSRVKPGKLAGRPIDVGGMWVGPSQTRLLELIKEYGLHTTPQFEDSKGASDLNGKRMLADREALGFDTETQAECERVMRELNQLSAQVPLDAPWTMPQAEEFDDMTVEDWFESKTQCVRANPSVTDRMLYSFSNY